MKITLETLFGKPESPPKIIADEAHSEDEEYEVEYDEGERLVTCEGCSSKVFEWETQEMSDGIVLCNPCAEEARPPGWAH